MTRGSGSSPAVTRPGCQPPTEARCLCTHVLCLVSQPRARLLGTSALLPARKTRTVKGHWPLGQHREVPGPLTSGKRGEGGGAEISAQEVRARVGPCLLRLDVPSGLRPHVALSRVICQAVKRPSSPETLPLAVSSDAL